MPLPPLGGRTGSWRQLSPQQRSNETEEAQKEQLQQSVTPNRIKASNLHLKP
jgi:hypothetical protein